MQMRKELIITADGSSTYYLPEINEHYHSHHGALQEAKHVFLKHGLAQFDPKKEISILEIGFGTGLNAWLTALERLVNEGKINYYGLEAYPLTNIEIANLNYTQKSENPISIDIFEQIHHAEWGKFSSIHHAFYLQKIKAKLEDLHLNKESIDLIYFDAFGPRVQPEMWNLEVFEKLASWLKTNACLVTYCAKGQVKRDLKSAGFVVETLEGPPGKREMIRAWKK